MAHKVGDRRDCPECGESKTSKYEKLTTNASFVGPGAAAPAEIPVQYGWFCESCGAEEPVGDSSDDEGQTE